MGERRLLALVRGHRMKRLLKRMLDPAEFLSDHGVRSLSRSHLANPYWIDLGGERHTVAYEPGRVAHGAVRRQLELARPGLVPDQLPADRGAPEVPPLLRRRLPGRVPDGLGPAALARRDRRPTSRAGCSRIFLPRRRRPPAGVRRTTPPRSIRTGATTSCSTSTSTATRAPASARRHQTGWTALVAKLLEQTGGARPDHDRRDGRRRRRADADGRRVTDEAIAFGREICGELDEAVAPRMARHQRPRWLRVGHGRGPADPALSRAAGRGAAAACRTARLRRRADRMGRRRRRVDRPARPRIRRRHHRPARLGTPRVVPAGWAGPDLALRDRRPRHREADRDGARRQHDLGRVRAGPRRSARCTFGSRRSRPTATTTPSPSTTASSGRS